MDPINRHDNKIFVRVVGPTGRVVNDMSLTAAKKLFHNGWRIEDPRYNEKGQPIDIGNASASVDATIEANQTNEFEPEPNVPRGTIEDELEKEAKGMAESSELEQAILNGPEETSPEQRYHEEETQATEQSVDATKEALKKVAFARSEGRLLEYMAEFEHLPEVVEKINQRLKKYK